MSMPPMQGPPVMRGIPGDPSGGLSPQGPGSGFTSPPPQQQASPVGGPGGTIGASRRRAYPTAHLAANSVSYSGGFDPGAQQAGGAPSLGGIPEAPQNQFFTPGMPDAHQQPHQQQQQQQPAPGAPSYGMQPQQPYPNGQPGQGGYQGGAPGAAGGMAGLANQFAGMGVGAAKGVSAAERHKDSVSRVCLLIIPPPLPPEPPLYRQSRWNGAQCQ